ncbi:MFS transporter [Rhodococcus antarcticus]|uniref:MFS transporter n=1 Tax=Rhodococcus antarcticus TaxID=2987751 RepID=A0ABY6NYN6_9NOCA|nr:MFS transporter [Rhodococcus antarcticus]UZJ24246.1 MFS transporter [Rhodococcus antarcticus]
MRHLRSLLADTTPLQTPAYRRLWVAGIVTVIGAQLTVVAVPLQVYSLTRSSAYVGLTGVFALVPLIVFGLWGGALADAVDRRTLLLVSTVGIGVTSLAFWAQAVAGVDNVWLVLVLLAVQTAFFGINQPTRSAIIPRLLPFDQVAAANALNMSVFQLGAIVGPVLAGVALGFTSLSTLYLVDTVLLLATLHAVLRLPALPPTVLGRKAGLREVLDGFRYLAGHTVLLASFVVDVIAMVAGMPRALFPEMAVQSFGAPEDGGTVLGLLFAGIGIGALAGGVFSGRLPGVARQGVAVVVAIAVWGLCMVGFGLAAGAGVLWLAVAFLAVGGAADTVSAVYRSTILLQAANDDVRGRLQGVFTVVVAGGPRLGDVTHGASAALVGTTAAAAGGGVLVVVGVVVAALAMPAFVRYRVVSRAGG